MPGTPSRAERRARGLVAVNGQPVAGGQDRLLLQLAALLEGFEQSLRLVLRLLHVRLVERIDAEPPAGDRRRDLPQEELFAEVVCVVERAVDDRVPGGFERLELRLGLAVGLAHGD